MKKYTQYLIILALCFLYSVSGVLAQEQNQLIDLNNEHYTLIVNQVRGTSCCDKGSLAVFAEQVRLMEEKNLRANFALRYDAIKDPLFVEIVKRYPNYEYGGLLEVIPELAQEAGVYYDGDETNWQEAQRVFLIGYSVEDRKKLIDTYMQTYQETFDTYPKFTNAWLIDTWSLKYLKSEYGVVAHEITREQYGTDSYTLYGGPVHYPYWPSQNWAFMPDAVSRNLMPLIIRQTITDPVYNYGDTSNSYTSQPNDYFIRGDTIEYFKYLFNQAHAQPLVNQTFALIGLENSMPQEAQAEFAKHIGYVADWQGDTNKVMYVSEFEKVYVQQLANVSVYSGVAQKESNEKAWWIETERYRVRLRLSNNELFISDLRIFDSKVIDPYMDKKSSSYGWWITPFVLDGSRFFYQATQNLNTVIRNDYLVNRKADYLSPTRIILTTAPEPITVNKAIGVVVIKQGEKILARFSSRDITLTQDTVLKQDSTLTKDILTELSWKAEDDTLVWGFQKNGDRYTPFIDSRKFNEERELRSQLLFPELKGSALDTTKTRVHVNNQYAIAGRNPIRLVLFPLDSSDNPIVLYDQPTIKTESEVDRVAVYQPHGSNGMVFIDVENNEAQENQVEIAVQNYSYTTTIYFAPNCKENVVYCFTHPRQAWWFVRSTLEDRKRLKQEQESKAEIFVDGTND